MPSILSAPHFHNEEAAFAMLESIVWGGEPVCPKCGGLDRITKVKGGRMGLYRCGPCKRQFTVTVGTVFERSHIKLHIWFQAAHLLASSKKGISAHQLHRTLGITYKAAWFMEHRLREAMRSGALAPLGGDGGTVEADETYHGHKDDPAAGKRTIRGKRSHGAKRSIVALVERGGEVRSFHVERADKETVTRIVSENIAKETRLNTDESALYNAAKDHVDAHETVKHTAGEYVRVELDHVNEDETEFYFRKVHTNTVEGVFSILKRGMHGTYHHCGERHLHRYLAEFDFRYNNRTALGIDDATRTVVALRGIVGKRLLYRDSSGG